MSETLKKKKVTMLIDAPFFVYVLQYVFYATMLTDKLQSCLSPNTYFKGMR